MEARRPYFIKWGKGAYQKAISIQSELSSGVELKALTKSPRLVAGVDCAFEGERVFAAATLLSFPELEPLRDCLKSRKTTLPYIPGLLSFREGPAALAAIEGLGETPDVIIFDGQGIAHPRRLGIASHLGVVLGIASIGCAKSRLIGSYREPGEKKGSKSALVYKGKRVGTVLRSRDNVRPVFVSPGHLVDFRSSSDIVLECAPCFRLPEPIRRADRLAGEFKRECAKT